MRVGLDFDNTIVSYDEAFVSIGCEEGLLPEAFRGDKPAVKAHLLAERPDGYLWEKLQGLVYGRRIGQATMFPGVDEFLQRCRDDASASAVIVSHKTIHAHHDPEGADLREAALGWMDAQGFFSGSRPLLDDTDVKFAGTRDAKVERIAELGCDIFIDDLVEVLRHPGMPDQCRKILFRGKAQPRFEQYQHWQQISDAIFGHG